MRAWLAFAFVLATSSKGHAGTPFHAAFRLFATGMQPGHVVVADLNGDCRPDILVSGSETEFSSLLGNGDGTFAPAILSNAEGPVCGAPALGDLDGDGILDLAFCSGTAVCIQFGNGDGTFGLRTCYPSTGAVSAIALADVNGDTYLDIISTETNRIVTLIGNGHGIFSPGGVTNFTFSGGQLGVGDFDGDGRPDVAVAQGTYPERVSVLRGIGDGTFSLAATIVDPFGVTGADIAVGNFSGSPQLDIMICGVLFESASVCMVAEGNGNGTFATPVSVGDGSDILATGSLDEDELTDRVVGTQGFAFNSISPTVAAIRTGSGSPDLEIRGGASDAAIGDLDRDGLGDLVLCGPLGSTVGIFIAQPLGGFEAPEFVRTEFQFAPLTPAFVESGIFSEDGRPDLTASMRATFGGGATLVMVADAAGNFSGTTYYQYSDTPPATIAVGDVNSDAHTDAVFLSPNQVALGNGNGGLHSPMSFDDLSSLTSAVVGRLDGDLVPDIAATTSNSVRILHGSGGGVFALIAELFTGSSTGLICATDFDHDGDLDLALVEDGHVSTLNGHGDGSFDAPIPRPTGGAAQAIALADLDADGHQDIAVSLDIGVATLRGRGDDTFSVLPTTAGPAGNKIMLGDWNGDARVDAAVAADGIAVYEGNGDGTFHATVLLGVGLTTSGSVAAADFGQDGHPDLALATSDLGGFTFMDGQESQNPAVHVDAPNSDITLAITRAATLSWTAADNAGVSGVDLLLSRHGECGPFEVIARNIADTGSFEWIVTGPRTDEALLRVRARDAVGNLGEDVSDQTFRIDKPLATLMTDFIAEATDEGVRVRWRWGPDVEPIFSVLERQDAARSWETVSDVQGRTVARLIDGILAAGKHEATWNLGRGSGGIAPGIYFLRFETPSGRDTRRIVLAR